MHRFVRMIICGLVAVGVTACIHTAARSAASCLHPVAPGDSVDMRDAQHPCIVHANGDPPTCFQPCTDPSSCAMPPGGGEHRMEFASAIVSNLGALSATFPVPPPPPASPGAAPLIYFFPAAQTDGGSTILQPVLQYGNNDTFGGNGWQIASWYLDCNGQSFHSQPMNVNAGDTITASMISTCSGDLCTWTIAAAASNAETKATVQSVLELHNVRST